MNNQALSHAAIKTPDPLRFEGKASDWFWGTLWKFRGYYV